MEEKNINLMNLFWYAVRKWRIILLIGLVCAVIFGGYKSVSYLSNEGTETLTEEIEAQYDAETYEEYNTAVATYTEQKVLIENEIVTIQSEIDILNSYIDESLLMSLDYENTVQTILLFYVDTQYEIVDGAAVQTINPVESILYEYYLKVAFGNFFELVSEALEYNIDINYIKEIVTYDRNVEEGFLRFIIKTNDATENEMITSVILEYMDEAYNECKEIINHTMYVFEPMTATYANDSLYASQQTVFSELSTLKSELNAKQASLSALIEPVLTESIIEQEVVVETENTKSEEFNFASVIIFAVIGVIFGSLATAGTIVLIAIGQNLMNDERNVLKACNLQLVGKKPQVIEKLWMDRIISKISNSSGIQTDEEFYNYIATSFNLSFSQADQIYLTGTIDFSKIEEIKNKIQGKTEAEIICVGNSTINSDALKSVSNASNIVLVEQLFKSKNDKVVKQIENIRNFGSEIKGVVII